MRHDYTLAELPSLFSRRLAKAMDQRAMTIAQLAHDSGVSRSAIARYIGSENTSLPNSFVVARLALTLDVSTDYLLGYGMQIPQQGFSFGADFFPDAYSSKSEVIELNFNALHNGYFIYICHTLPDLLKTGAVLRAELEGEHDTGAYAERMEALRQLSEERLNTGIVLIDKAVLDQLQNCRGIYKSLTKQESRSQLRIIHDFLQGQHPSVSCYVVNYMRDRLTTAFLSPPSRLTTYFLGGYLTMGNPQIYQVCRDNALTACRRGLSFFDYIASAN